jgi:hypothetical protein
MYNDLLRKGYGVEFTYAFHISRTAEVNILARDANSQITTPTPLPPNNREKEHLSPKWGILSFQIMVNI